VYELQAVQHWDSASQEIISVLFFSALVRLQELQGKSCMLVFADMYMPAINQLSVLGGQILFMNVSGFKAIKLHLLGFLNCMVWPKCLLGGFYWSFEVNKRITENSKSFYSRK
jgi:hypothetical protein